MMFSHNWKLFFTCLFAAGLSIVLGGCIGIKDKLVGMAEWGTKSDFEVKSDIPAEDVEGPLFACGLQEVTAKDAGLDSKTFWQEPQILALQQALEARGLKPVGAERIFASPSAKLGFMPFGSQGGIAWREQNGRRQAVAVVKHADGTLNLYPDGQAETWTAVHAQELVEQLRQRDKVFQALEQKLTAQRKQIIIERSLALTVTGKGILYLAVGSRTLTRIPELSYYRAKIAIGATSWQLMNSPTDACASGEYSVAGFKDGEVKLIGVYRTKSKNAKLSTMGLSTDLCLMEPGALACLNTRPSLSVRRVDVQGDNISMELLFESTLQQRLHIRYSFFKQRKEAVITLESPQGDRLQGYARILQSPDERKCAAFWPPDSSNPQRLQEAYQCLTAAGLRVELRLQLNEHTVTIPAELLSQGDYATVEQLVQTISKRAKPDFKKTVEAFTALTDNEVKECLLGQQTQPSASRMITLGNCAVTCGLAALGYGLSWASLFLGPPGTVAGAVVWIVSHLTTVGGGAYGCGSCLKNNQNQPPPPPPPPPGSGCFTRDRSMGLMPTPC